MVIKKIISLICFILITSIVYCDVPSLNKLNYQTILIKNIEGEKLKNSILETVQDLGFFITSIKLEEKNYKIYATNYLKDKSTKLEIELENRDGDEYILRLNIHGFISNALEEIKIAEEVGEQACQNFIDSLKFELSK